MLNRSYAVHALVAFGVLLCSLVYSTWAGNQLRSDTGRQSLAELGIASTALKNPLANAAGDVRVLAHDSDVIATLNPEAGGSRIETIRYFSDMLVEKHAYTGIRLLDAKGREILSVRDTAQAGATVVDADLKDRSGTDYFQATQSLKPGQVYVSAIQPYAEDGHIRMPTIPVVYLSMPLHTPGGVGGVLVLTMTMERAFGRLQTILAVGIGESWVLDADGYWLVNADDSLRWGRQLDSGHRLAQLYPDVWSALRSGQSTLRTPQGLFMMMPFRVDSGDDALVGEPVSAGFTLISRIPPGTMVARLSSAFGPGFWLALIVALAITQVIGTSLSRAREAAAAELISRLTAEAEANERAALREEVYRTSLAMQGTNEPGGFALAMLAELAPLLNAACAALFRIDESGGRFRLLGGYALSSNAAQRKLWIGQGTIGEAVRSGKPIVLDPVPAAYSQSVAGEGAVAPGIVMVVPLRARAHIIGVLEIGLLTPLNKHQQEILDQLLPFIGLNLDSLLSHSKSD